MSDPTLAGFLAARLDEDEAAAKAATPGPWMAGAEREHLVDNVVYGQSEWPDHIQQVCNVDYAEHKAGNATHIARHDPARVLREVQAGRRLLREHRAQRHEDCDTLRILAAVYSDHPDYREEWKP